MASKKHRQGGYGGYGGYGRHYGDSFDSRTDREIGRARKAGLSERYRDDPQSAQLAKMARSPSLPTQTRRDARMALRILQDPALQRFLGEEGRAGMFAEQADQYDATFQQGLDQGRGSLALAGLGSSAAPAAFESQMYAERAGSLAKIRTNTDLGHANAAWSIRAGIWNQLMGREQGQQGMMMQANAASSGMWGGIGQGIGTVAGAVLSVV